MIFRLIAKLPWGEVGKLYGGKHGCITIGVNPGIVLSESFMKENPDFFEIIPDEKPEFTRQDMIGFGEWCMKTYIPLTPIVGRHIKEWQEKS